ncbi:hypothetical protein [Granulicella sp. dw_53]|uniref:hypothetical protein n=1 Tax=Granulicella sp. dw_53 TaxID=2719792 RepID=UPI001BD367DC|nr:hypothetical protein [Granulicella sp. dw_53]
MKKTKYVCLALLLVVAAYEIMLFAWSAIAEHKAKSLTELIATLKPGYTTKDDAMALFQAHRWNVRVDNNACSTSKGSCEALAVGASNFPPIIPVHLGRLAGITLFPLPPVKTAGFVANLYFINRVLDSINVGFRVGTTGVGYSRYAGDHNFRSSEWKYENGGMVVSIGVASSGVAFDVPFPRFSFNYMYSVRCVDARMLWPTAPPPTTELHGWPGCR